MKKSVLGALVAILSVSSVALAANPFSDVPQGHWAYGAVAQLAANGVVEGYGDGRFSGAQPITRYEMAQIVAKAMAKGAVRTDDKLVAEFAKELESLGVRVTKLEKKTDNVKVTGEIRISYMDEYRDKVRPFSDGNLYGSKHPHGRSLFEIRSRLNFHGSINKDWSYYATLENDQYAGGSFSNVGNLEKTMFQRGYVKGRLGGFKVQGGRYENYFSNGAVMTHRLDGIMLNYGKDLKLTLETGKLWGRNDINASDNAGDKFYRAAVGWNNKHWNIQANYIKADNVQTMLWQSWNGYPTETTVRNPKGIDDRIFSLDVKYTNADWYIDVLYTNSKADGTPPTSSTGKNYTVDGNGFIIGIGYKGAKANKVGSWGIFGRYYHTPAAGILWNNAIVNDLDYFRNIGIKGYTIGANWTIAPNMTLQAEWWDQTGLEDDFSQRSSWVHLVWRF